MCSAILAVALSLATTNDYMFTAPPAWPTNAIQGLGIGESGDYAMMRLEDVAFLREAETERWWAVRPGTDFLRVDDAMPQPVPMVANGWANLRTYYLSYCFAESFDSDYWYNGRGVVNSFVGPGFALASGQSGAFFDLETNASWTVKIPYAYGPGEREHDLRDDYAPYVSAGGQRIAPPDLRTNGFLAGWQKIPSMAVMTNAYHNITLCGRIATAPDYDFGPMSGSIITDRSTVNLYNWETSHRWDAADGRWYEEYTGVVHTNHWYVDTNTWTISGKEQLDGLPPLERIKSYVVLHTAPINWQPEDPYDRFSDFEPNFLQERLTRDGYIETTITGGEVLAYTPCIVPTNLHLCSGIGFQLAAGFRYTRSESGYSKYDSSDLWSTNRTEYAVYHHWFDNVPQANILVADERAWGGTAVVWRVGISIGEVMEAAFRRLVDPSDMAHDVLPDVSSVPGRVDYNAMRYGAVTGNHSVMHTVRLMWLRGMFTFDRDYRAKVLERNQQ